MKINLGDVVKFRFKGKRLVGRVTNIESTKFGKLIYVSCLATIFGLTHNDIVEVVKYDTWRNSKYEAKEV